MNELFAHLSRIYPFCVRYLAAGQVREIEPAGDMWSVETLSPKYSNTRAFSMWIVVDKVVDLVCRDAKARSEQRKRRA